MITLKISEEKCIDMIVVSPAVGFLMNYWYSKIGKAMLHLPFPLKYIWTILWYSVSADHFHIYRHHDNMVHIQGECKDYLNLPEKMIPWAFFTLLSELIKKYIKYQFFKSNKPNESYVHGLKKY